jgi:LysR family transcriptional regulator for metE and metH
MALPSPRLDVRDLQLVLALARAGSTVKAAASLHVTQSAVSRGLLLAEEKLGTRLFERTARGLAPTKAGERLIAGAAPVLAQLVELERHAEAPVREPVRLRLACECYTAYRWLPSTVASLQRTTPSLEVTLALEHTRAPAEALANGDLDVALLTTGRVRGAGIEERALFSDEIVFVVSRAHPLASRPALAVADLLEHALITSSQTPDAETRWFASRVFGRTAARVRHLRLPFTEAIVDAARAGMGIAVLSEWIATPYLDAGDLVVKRLRGRALRRPWRIAFTREAADGARRLAAALEPAAPRMYPAAE